MQIYISRDGEQNGPYSLDEIREQLAQGKIQSEQLVIHEQLNKPVPLSEILATDESGPTSYEASLKPAKKKTSLLKKFFWGILLSLTLYVCVITYVLPVPLPDIKDLEGYISEEIVRSNNDNKRHNVKIKIESVTKSPNFYDFQGTITYQYSIELSKPNGSQGLIEGKFTVKFMGIFYKDWASIYNMIGRHALFENFSEISFCEKEVRKFLRQKFDSKLETRDAAIDFLSLRQQGYHNTGGESAFEGNLEITARDGAKKKLKIKVTDHGLGRLYIETK